MTSREVVGRTIKFEGADRIPYALAPEYGSDFASVGMVRSPDARPKSGVDEWGCVWENIGVSNLGEVKQPVLTDWADWDNLTIPDIRDPKRWESLADARNRAGDKFLMAEGISLYERVHFLRGLEDTWVDIHTNPEELGRLTDIPPIRSNEYPSRRHLPPRTPLTTSPPSADHAACAIKTSNRIIARCTKPCHDHPP